jgi:hypothetical protein
MIIIIYTGVEWILVYTYIGNLRVIVKILGYWVT